MEERLNAVIMRGATTVATGRMLKGVGERADPGHHLEAGSIWPECCLRRKRELSTNSSLKSGQLVRDNAISKVDRNSRKYTSVSMCAKECTQVRVEQK